MEEPSAAPEPKRKIWTPKQASTQVPSAPPPEVPAAENSTSTPDAEAKPVKRKAWTPASSSQSKPSAKSKDDQSEELES